MNGNNMRPIPMPENIDTNTQSIRELQEFLRRIAYSNEQIPLVAIDGIYGNETKAAVTEFQKLFGLPQTGEVDEATWNAIVEEFQRLTNEGSLPERIRAFPSPATVLMPGDYGAAVYFLQVMLKAIAQKYDNLPNVSINGFYDDETREAAEELKKLLGVDSQGLNNISYDKIVKLFNSLYNE
ncbi:MAG: peptidoglycan-binding protein [Clostridia bacterium]|nr:peptidoglycan-binding protein [Clostridia bacterium]